MKFAFWALWILDALVASVFLYFFFVGIGDGSVSSFNIVEWLCILAVLGAVLGGSFFLRARGLGIVSLIVLALIAVPAVGFALIMGTTIILNPRWN